MSSYLVVSFFPCEEDRVICLEKVRKEVEQQIREDFNWHFPGKAPYR